MEKLPAAVGVFALLLGEEKGHQSEQTSITRFPVSDFTKDEDADNDCQEVDQGKSFWRYSNNGKEGIFNPPRSISPPFWAPAFYNAANFRPHLDSLWLNGNLEPFAFAPP